MRKLLGRFLGVVFITVCAVLHCAVKAQPQQTNPSQMLPAEPRAKEKWREAVQDDYQ